ncbi:MAG TPA: hypothetical protein VGC42_02455 [Kofleriaceae bacterium]
MVSPWDGLVRLWLISRTWLALRRPVSGLTAVTALAKEQDPARFVRLALVPAAGELALALAWLPRRSRLEAQVMLLAGLALRELDRRAAAEVDALARLGNPVDGALGRDRVRAAVAFLAGSPSAQTVREPGEPAPRPEAARFDSVRGVLAGRLPTLRAAIERLPGDAVRRCRAMIEQLGDSVIHDRLAASSGSPGADTFGEAVMYAMRLAAPTVRPPDTTCRAVGRAFELIATLDAGAATAHRDRLRARATSELAHVPRLARWLPGRVGGGTRAAAALLITSECARLLRASAAGALPRLRPLRAALAAARSRKAYLATVDRAVEAVLAVEPSLAHGTLDTRIDLAPSPTIIAPTPPPDGDGTVSPVRITIHTPARGTHAPPLADSPPRR